VFLFCLAGTGPAFPWAAPYKRGSLYYLVYAGSGEKISYATSNAPAGPWTYKGDVWGNPSIGTNHPGVVDYKGHSYFFYHNGALPGGGSYKRLVCVEEFTYGSDGSIPKLTGSTAGPAAVATLNPFEQVEAETIAFSSGLKTEVCTDTGAGMNVTSVSNGDYIKVKNVDFLDGVTSFDARVSSSSSNAKIELHLDSQTGTLLGTCDVSGASSWTTKTCSVSGGSGKHDLFLKFTGGSGDLLKFNWWKFTGPTTTPDGGAGGAGGGGAGGTGGGAGGGSTAYGGTAGGSSTANGGSATNTGGSSAANNGGSATNTGGRSSSSGGISSNAGGRSSSSGGRTSQTGGGTSASNGGVTASNGGTMTASNGGVTASSGGTMIQANGGQPGTTSKTCSGGNVGSSAGSGSGAVDTHASGASAISATVEAGAPANSGGCACRVGAGHRNNGASAALWLVASALLVRRRSAGKRTQSGRRRRRHDGRWRRQHERRPLRLALLDCSKMR
jgi:hypothetical protein